MVGIGPLYSHHDTPFAEMESGTLELTLFLIRVVTIDVNSISIAFNNGIGSIHSWAGKKAY
jgi:biotin synthase